MRAMYHGYRRNVFSYALEDIAFAVKSLGVVEGDIIVVHSSLSSLGCVDGGADTLIDAFIEVLGPNGTMIMPTLCQRDKERRFETWDIAKSPSDVGKTTEAFRLRPQSLRSNHPTHSVAAAGRLAAEIVSGHPSDYGRTGPWGDAAFAKGSPWQKIYDLNAGIVMVGVDLKANTMVHFIEHLIVERALAQASTISAGLCLISWLVGIRQGFGQASIASNFSRSWITLA